MNFDRNTVIGFVLLALLFFGYFFYNYQDQQAFREQKRIKDSIALANQPKPDTAALRRQQAFNDSAKLSQQAGGLDSQIRGTESVAILENESIRVGISNKGGAVKWVEIKGQKAPDSSLVRLGASPNDGLSYEVNTGAGRTLNSAQVFFTPSAVASAPNGAKTISYTLASPGGTLTHQYTLPGKGYMIDLNLGVNGAALFTANTLNLTWRHRAVQLQKDLDYEKQNSVVAWYANGDYDSETPTEADRKVYDKEVKWVSVKQQFFNATLISKTGFSGGNIDWTVSDSGRTVVDAVANLRMPAASGATIPLQLYYGPTDYKVLKAYGLELEDQVNLGSGMFAFVKWINRWIVVPLFSVFEKLTSNYGIVILLLTLAIRLIISPLNYKAYLSGAKMKALRPEIEKLKAKYGDDQQQIQMEQMKLFREGGVNPLGGCIPSLLQIPIFFALYSFFNSNVALRGKPFLWATDLSQYDSILSFPEIPLLGDHLSLFTITACLTSMAISLYSMNSMPDQSNPVMKYMPYIFPVIMLFFFNKLPSGLTWYYTVSNVITLALQWVIQTYIINDKKILAKIEENRKKPKKESGWSAKLQQMQEQQRKLQAERAKGKP